MRRWCCASYLRRGWCLPTEENVTEKDQQAGGSSEGRHHTPAFQPVAPPLDEPVFPLCCVLFPFQSLPERCGKTRGERHPLEADNQLI